MNTVKSTLLLGAMTGLLMLVGELLGGRGGMTMALLMAGVMNFAAFFWSDKIVLRTYHAQPVTPEEAPGLYQVVQTLALKANIPTPRMYVLPTRRSTPSPPAAARNTRRWRSPRGCCTPWTRKSWKACSRTSCRMCSTATR
jgi:heat shock protein HtpX